MAKQSAKIRVSAGEDLLAFIPHMVGYWPKDSIVCIGMGGKQLRATMRLDLPPDNEPDTARYAGIAAAQLSSDSGADGCLIAIFGREDWAEPENFPQTAVYQALRAAFSDVGLPVRDAWYVGPQHWRSVECVDAGCCPWPGTDNASIKASFVNAEFIFRGSAVGKNPKEQIQELVAVRNHAFAASVAAAGEGLAPALAARGAGAQQLSTTLGAWEHALTRWPQTPDPAMAAFLLASLGEGTVRDTVIVALAASPEHALVGAAGLGLLRPDTGQLLVPRNWYGGNQASVCEVDLEAFSDSAYLRACRDFGNILAGEVGVLEHSDAVVGPDWARVDRAEPLLQFLAAATNSQEKAPVLCLLGWIQWCKGRGTWAGNYFQACLEFQPGYRLAGLLDQLVAVGHIAECAKDPRTAWRRSGPVDAADRAA